MLKPKLDGVKKTLQHYDFPVDVIVEVTRYCNLKCIMCPYPTLKRSQGNMKFDIFKKIVDEVAHESPKSRIWLAIMGEPLYLKDKLSRYIQYAKEAGVETINLNTNAVLLTKKLSKELINSGVDKIIISIDADTESVYDQIRVGGDLNKVKENVQHLLEQIKESKSKKPEVITQFIVMEENEHEMDNFKEYWLERGAVVKIRPKLGWCYSVDSSILEQTEKVETRFPCSWITRTVSIHWDGKFSQCDADYEGIYSPGDINNQTIKEIWTNELQKRRDRHWNNDYNFEPCNNCSDWLAGRSSFYYPTEEVK